MNNKQTALAIAARFFFRNVNTDEVALAVYAAALEVALVDADADPSTHECPVWQQFADLPAGEFIEHLDSLAADIERALHASVVIANRAIADGSNDAEHEALVEIAAGGDE
jgi:hypothetical protein